MTHSQNLFLTYSSSSGHDKVHITNGSFSSIAGRESLRCNSSITLPYVLHLPNFSHNLLSISALKKDLNCKVTSYPSSCVIQELSTEKTIGYGRVEMDYIS